MSSRKPGNNGAIHVPTDTQPENEVSEDKNIGINMYMAFLENIILPSIINYYLRIYKINATPEELLQNAFNMTVETKMLNGRSSYSDATPVTKENASRKPRQIDLVNGCQYLMDRSRSRKGEVCGEKRELPGFFCKQCKRKKAFRQKAVDLAEKMGLTYEEVASPNIQYPEENTVAKPIQRRGGTGIKAGSGGGRASNVPISYPSHSKVPDKPFIEQTVEQSDDTQTLNGIEIDGLDNILYDVNTGIVFYCNTDGSEVVAFGQWTEDEKIARMTESLRETAKQFGLLIGDYTKYDLHHYAIDDEKEKEMSHYQNGLTPVSNLVQTSVPVSTKEPVSNLEQTSVPVPTKEPAPEPAVLEERLHAIPGRRPLRRK